MLITTVTYVTPQRYRVVTINNSQSCNEKTAMAVAGARYESGWRGVINKVHTNSPFLLLPLTDRAYISPLC